MMKKTKKKWKMSVNVVLTVEEGFKLIVLSKMREQSIRDIVTILVKDELKAYDDKIIENFSKYMPYNSAHPLDESLFSKPRRTGRSKDEISENALKNSNFKLTLEYDDDKK